MSNRFRPRTYDRTAPAADHCEPAASLALPKPQYVPRGERVDRSELAHGLDAPERDKSYLQFVRGHVCAVNAGYNHECGGVTEAAHLETAGTGIKASDFLTVPLCTIHHRIQHEMGIAQFQQNYATNLWETSTRQLVQWLRKIRRSA